VGNAEMNGAAAQSLEVTFPARTRWVSSESQYASVRANPGARRQVSIASDPAWWPRAG